MEHVGIVVNDLAAATAFFVELGLKPQGEGSVEGGWVDRMVGLEGVRPPPRQRQWSSRGGIGRVLNPLPRRAKPGAIAIAETREAARDGD